ncbi:hypothetical protein GGR52DRAFT_245113 [Hypoxylon sp. FL1284]|nr:hypothetical protein GGR52DRAFT_245113 [Hypoxylon sp. FL1284]
MESRLVSLTSDICQGDLHLKSLQDARHMSHPQSGRRCMAGCLPAGCSRTAHTRMSFCLPLVRTDEIGQARRKRKGADGKVGRLAGLGRLISPITRPSRSYAITRLPVRQKLVSRHVNVGFLPFSAELGMPVALLASSLRRGVVEIRPGYDVTWYSPALKLYSEAAGCCCSLPLAEGISSAVYSSKRRVRLDSLPSCSAQH